MVSCYCSFVSCLQIGKPYGGRPQPGQPGPVEALDLPWVFNSYLNSRSHPGVLRLATGCRSPGLFSGAFSHTLKAGVISHPLQCRQLGLSGSEVVPAGHSNQDRNPATSASPQSWLSTVIPWYGRTERGLWRPQGWRGLEMGQSL